MGDSLGYSFQWSGGKFTVFNPPFSVENVAYGISNSGPPIGGNDTDYSGSPYPWPIYGAFVEVLKATGVGMKLQF